VKVFLNERRHLPTESRRRIGRHSRAVEQIFEDVLRAGVKAGEFRPDLDARLAALAILGTVNAVAAWYGKEPAVSLERIASYFSSLIIGGIERRRTRR
jgi:hypothetical protein